MNKGSASVGTRLDREANTIIMSGRVGADDGPLNYLENCREKGHSARVAVDLRSYAATPNPPIFRDDRWTVVLTDPELSR